MLCFGLPGSGKTTFQWFLLNYLMHERESDVQLVLGEGDSSGWDMRRLVNEWKDSWVRGGFPEANPVDEAKIMEINWQIRLPERPLEPLNFRFVEMSGELFEAVMPNAEGSKPKLPKLVTEYFRNPKFKLVVMLMLHPDSELQKNDKLFASFLDYIRLNHPDAQERISLGIIVSHPDEALEFLRKDGSLDGRHNYDGWDADALHDYAARYCGETYQKWERWPGGQKKTILAKFYLGEINDQKVLIDRSFDNMESIFSWLYEQFTGKRLRPTLWKRVKAWFRGIREWE